MDTIVDHCWCCGSILTTKNTCPICDSPGMMSPPHYCKKNDVIFTDEDGCMPSDEIPEVFKDGFS